MEDNGETPDAVASATAPALPSLKKDNCIVNGRYRAVFVAEENIRLYIGKFGEQYIGVLTVTVADCVEAKEFQARWHSFLNALRKLFPNGMWTRERQPRSGNWHAHAVVNVGWDIQTGFPRDQVQAGFYANVNARLRVLWKCLREMSESHGFGRIELVPLKYSGAACARYLSKYLTKVLASEKCLGEEKCRLFGVWGGMRFVHSRFSFLTSRIVQKRKAWLAEALELNNSAQLPQVLGPHWWFHFGRTLCEVIMPEDFYKVGPKCDRRWDMIGSNSFTRDCAAWPGTTGEDRMYQSQFTLFRDIGGHLFGPHRREAMQFALNRIALAEPRPSIPLDPQLILNLEAAIERTKKTRNP